MALWLEPPAAEAATVTSSTHRRGRSFGVPSNAAADVGFVALLVVCVLIVVGNV